MFSFLDFFLLNSIQIILTIAILIFMLLTDYLNKKHKLQFIILLILNMLFVISDYFDLSIKFAPAQSLILPFHAHIRDICIGLSYTFKACILFLFIISFFEVSRRNTLVLAVPGVVSIIIACASIWTDWVYYVDDSNVFHDGPLKTVYMAIIFFYFGTILVSTFLTRKKISPIEYAGKNIIVILITSSTIINMTTDSRFNLLSLSIIISILIYYLCMYLYIGHKLLYEKDQELDRKELDLKISQIQPHFLYNTLSAIRDLCIEDPKLAESTVLNFSSYLRNNLDLSSNNKSLIDIEKEIEHTKFYTNIEQVRFENIEVIYNIDDCGYSVPFLTIQPMVENAIRHGVRAIENGKVEISLFKENFYHVIVIKDNGHGLNEINNLGEHKHIGIENVRNRIETLCDGSLDVEFTSNGTTVTILIPII